MRPAVTSHNPVTEPPIHPADPEQKNRNPVEGVLSVDGSTTLGWKERWQRFPWSLILLLTLTSLLGLVVLYSAAGGHLNHPDNSNIQFIIRQAVRFTVGLALLFVVAIAGSERIYRRYAYLAYGISLALLIAVFLFGSVSMGARRWLDLGFMRLQPSELMKVTLVLALARYYHDRAVVAGFGLRDLALPLLLIMLPVALILKQPDLGTAIIIATVGMAVIVIAGLSWKMITLSLCLLAAGLPVAWNAMHDYQRQRVYTLFFPEHDPLGSGYHIIQSKIAVGSGGFLGKGFLNGSQSHLDFLPERHTDFIFSVLAEEWGFVGCITLMLLYLLITARGLLIAATAQHRFGLLTAVGFIALFSFQVIINIGMVIGLLPVVGIPLPLISYGGSSMITLLFSMGLIAHVAIYAKHYRKTIE
ncbi:rod shape-determining protein RodA [Candidatus Magnetaquicoccus inordinatus]|uniref:rod shape-determining protein RodA n=1 Tax=Candidatus Magnetaquicoccus inordinatus TaxID=2496818 RepID=UPI00102BD713|nr:rod shape-determining protein RodA [Candidatus Magnetaquicoccus inordinatus]